MGFPCPACRGPVDGAPRWLQRCPGCRVLLRARAVDVGRDVRAFDVEVVGRPAARGRVELPWTDLDRGRLRAWLAWSTSLTLGLALALYLIARWGGP